MGKIAIKEIFILVLLLIVILFVMGVMFYDYIPSNKVVPEPIEYAADSKVTATLQEIAATTDENVDGEFADDGSLLKSYSIGTSDLQTYASRKEYESGKTDPFADYTGETSQGGNGNSSNNTNNNNGNNSSNSSNSSNTNTSTGNNSSTGTFFEKPNSK